MYLRLSADAVDTVRSSSLVQKTKIGVERTIEALIVLQK